MESEPLLVLKVLHVVILIGLWALHWFICRKPQLRAPIQPKFKTCNANTCAISRNQEISSNQTFHPASRPGEPSMSSPEKTISYHTTSPAFTSARKASNLESAIANHSQLLMGSSSQSSWVPGYNIFASHSASTFAFEDRIS